MSYPSAPYPEYPAKSSYPEYPASPPPMGFVPQQQAPPPVYVVHSTPAMQHVAVVFGPGSLSMTCPHCNCAISTETQSSHKTCTHICCLLLFCSIGCSLFSCLPYFFCDPGTVEHFCPNCKAKLGTYHS